MILMLHSQLTEQTGGMVGVRDFNLLESALETPFQTFVLEYTQKELYEMVLAAADGSLEYEDMLRWVLEHQDYKKGETEWQEFLMKKT